MVGWVVPVGIKPPYPGSVYYRALPVELQRITVFTRNSILYTKPLYPLEHTKGERVRARERERERERERARERGSRRASKTLH